MSRRIAVAIFGLVLVVGWSVAETIPLSKALTYTNLTAHIGQSFYVYGGEKGLRKVVSLEIIEVSERKQDPKTEQFVVRFRGPRSPVLSKSVYTFEHQKTADTFRLFLEPEKLDTKGHYYRSVFNLLR